jgi:hypothetical protein
MVLLGGIFLGGGLFLHGLVASAEYFRSEVANTFFLWRWIGSITFPFQDDTTRLALWLHEVPRPMVGESARSAWTLIAIGGLLAVLSPFCRQREKRGRKKRSGRTT